MKTTLTVLLITISIGLSGQDMNHHYRFQLRTKVDSLIIENRLLREEVNKINDLISIRYRKRLLFINKSIVRKKKKEYFLDIYLTKKYKR